MNEVMLWMKEWPNNRVGNKNFKEFVSYQNVSLWWFVNFWFYNVSASVIRNIELNADRKERFKHKIMKTVMPFAAKQFKAFKSHLRKFPTIKPIINNEKYKILMITHPTYIQPSVLPTGERIEEDVILGPIIRELEKYEVNIVVVDTDPFPTLRLSFLFNKNYKHIEGYLTREINEVVSQKSNEFSKKWKELKQSNFVNDLIYKNVKVFKPLEDKFSELFHRKFIEAIKYIEMMKRIIELEKPNVIVIVDEYGLYGKAAVLVGKINNIPTLAIQHGKIHPVHCGYYDTGFAPDITVVGGKYYKNVLLKMKYPSEIIVTGLSKYDIIASADKVYDSKKIRRQLEIDPNKKLIEGIAESTEKLEEKFDTLTQMLAEKRGVELLKEGSRVPNI